MMLAALLTPDETSALLLTLRVSIVAVAVMLVPGILLGWLLARVRFPGRTIVDAIVHLPLVLPPVVIGYVLLLLFGRRGWLGSFLHDSLGIDIAFTWKAAALAAAVMSFPLLVRPVRLAIELADLRLEQAARTLGANRLRTFLTITVPLAMPGILTGAILAFARSLGEFGATITFAGNFPDETRTLPLALYTYTQTPAGEGPAMRLVVISIVLALGAMIVSELVARRMRKAAAL